MVSTISIVSLSSELLSEDFVKHEVDLGIQRLKDWDLILSSCPHSLKGLDFIRIVDDLMMYLKVRAEDLMQAFFGRTCDRICAISGDGTYRLLPYL